MEGSRSTRESDCVERRRSSKSLRRLPSPERISGPIVFWARWPQDSSLLDQTYKLLRSLNLNTSISILQVGQHVPCRI